MTSDSQMYLVKEEFCVNTIGMEFINYLIKGANGLTYAETRYPWVADIIAKALNEYAKGENDGP